MLPKPSESSPSNTPYPNLEYLVLMGGLGASNVGSGGGVGASAEAGGGCRRGT